jgi:hypothetical protein
MQAVAGQLAVSPRDRALRRVAPLGELYNGRFVVGGKGLDIHLCLNVIPTDEGAEGPDRRRL